MDDLGPFAVLHSHTHDFVANSNGAAYRVFVSPMQAERSETPVPVLYSTDANGGFGTLLETARMMIIAGEIEPAILVGIGYPVEHLLGVPSLRAHELTPSVDAGAEARAGVEGPPLPAAGLGGSAGFLEFIEHELAPALEAEYNASATDRGISGYSLGGLFAAYALLQPKPAFQRYIIGIGSPSLWWNDRQMFALERARFESGEPLSGRVFISAGELEEAPQFRKSLPYRMVSNAIEFAGMLGSRGYEGLSVKTHIFPGESHVSAIAPTLARGLRVVYGSGEP